MKFSVIIPVYNAENYINESVSSVLNQTYKNFEIVLVDDGSTDKSGDICDALKNEYPNIIKVLHQVNQGQLMSRCYGAKISDGDYCVYLDADDILYQNCLETLAKTINAFSMPGIVAYNYESLSSSGVKKRGDVPLEYKKVYKNNSKKEVYEAFIKTYKLNSMCNKAIKRSILTDIERFGFKFRSLRCAEDRAQVMECITRAETILFVEDILYCYRLFDGSVTRNFDISQVDKFNIKLLCEEEEIYLEKWGMNTSEWKMNLEADFLNNAMYIFCKFYEKSETRKQKQQLIKYNWLDFVPGKYLKNLSENSCVSDVYKRLWQYVINKNYFKINVFFIRKSLYKKIRDTKRKLYK